MKDKILLFKTIVKTAMVDICPFLIAPCPPPFCTALSPATLCSCGGSELRCCPEARGR